MRSLFSFLFVLNFFLVVGSAAYHLFCIYCAANFLRDDDRRGHAAPFTPPVSILKPVRGLDEAIYQCWASHCRQDYPAYELIFGVREADDPAIAGVERLKREFPHVPIKLIVNHRMVGASAKVSNLHNILPEASHEIIFLNDSDILVTPNYLREVVAPLADERVGVVTCLYRAVGGRTLPARLEAIGITGEFHLGVLVARTIEGVRFALGSTIATRKAVIDRIGGFETIADYLGDDYLIGNLATEKGYDVVISQHVVDTVLPDYTFGEFLAHQLRWARSTKFLRPSGYLGLIFTHATVLSLSLILLSPTSKFGLTAALFTLATRLAAAWYVGVIGLRDTRLKWNFPLLPIRDAIGFVIWLVSFSGNTVEWRGSTYRLATGGRLRLIDGERPATAD